MIDHRKPYFVISVPRVPARFQTEWHLSDNDPQTASWSSLMRGAFTTEEAAIQWGKDHLGGTPYSVKLVDDRALLVAELAQADAAHDAALRAMTNDPNASIALAESFVVLLTATLELAAFDDDADQCARLKGDIERERMLIASLVAERGAAT